MYEDFYRMKHTPFSRNVPSEDLYESAAMADCLGRLSYVADRQLFAVVTADGRLWEVNADTQPVFSKLPGVLNALGCSVSRPDISQSNCCHVS